MATEKHEPAYPNPGEMWNGNKVSGLTKREYFAALAMQGLSAFPGIIAGQTKITSTDIAKVSVKYADALIAELNK